MIKKAPELYRQNSGPPTLGALNILLKKNFLQKIEGPQGPIKKTKTKVK